MPLPGQAGVIVGIGGRPLAMQLFAHPDLLAAAYPALVAAAAGDAAGTLLRRTTGHQARSFARAAAGLRWTTTGPAGEGAALRSEGATLRGRGVQWRDRALHTSVLDAAHPLVTA